MSKTLSIYSPRHVLQLYMVPRSKLQLLFPGEIIKVATTYQFIICGRRDANACKRPTLQTIQLKRIERGQEFGHFGCVDSLDSILVLPYLFRSLDQSAATRPRTEEGPWNNCSPRIETNPAFHRKRPVLGQDFFLGAYPFGARLNSLSLVCFPMRASDLAPHPPGRIHTSAHPPPPQPRGCSRNIHRSD